VSRTKVRTWIFRDPILRKGGAHNRERYVPDTDEQLEEWLEQQKQDENRQRNEEDETYE
jgi:hypothetical protein